MAEATAKKGNESANARRGMLARPLDSLIFLVPLIVFFEIMVTISFSGTSDRPDRVVAIHLIRWFLQLFGHAGFWAPAVAIVIILLSTHMASREKWSIRWSRVWLMYPEAAFLAIPLLALNSVFPLTASVVPSSVELSDMALGIGAGVYEELVFRLVLISVLMMIGVDLLGLSRTKTAVVAILFSAVAFAAHHHQPFGAELFNMQHFLFRSMAGLYLAVVFWYRGYGLAAGCHAAYNAALIMFG